MIFLFLLFLQLSLKFFFVPVLTLFGLYVHYFEEGISWILTCDNFFL